MERALQFLRSHKDVALVTSEGNIPKLRIFRVMKQEGDVLYFATSEQKAVWRELRKDPNVELIAHNFFFYKTNFHLFYCFVATTLPNKLAIKRLRVATNSDKVTTEIRKPPVGEVYNVLERLY